MYLERFPAAFCCDLDTSRGDLSKLDKWILSRLAHMVLEVNKALSTSDFHFATSALKTFLYSEFCDFYLVSKCMGNWDVAICGAKEKLGSCVTINRSDCFFICPLFVGEKMWSQWWDIYMVSPGTVQMTQRCHSILCQLCRGADVYWDVVFVGYDTGLSFGGFWVESMVRSVCRFFCLQIEPLISTSRIVPQIRAWTLPSTSFPIHCIGRGADGIVK
jgi:hypothetical protein